MQYMVVFGFAIPIPNYYDILKMRFSNLIALIQVSYAYLVKE